MGAQTWQAGHSEAEVVSRGGRAEAAEPRRRPPPRVESSSTHRRPVRRPVERHLGGRPAARGGRRADGVRDLGVALAPVAQHGLRAVRVDADHRPLLLPAGEPRELRHGLLPVRHGEVVVLAGEQPLREHAPRQAADAEVGAHRQQVALRGALDERVPATHARDGAVGDGEREGGAWSSAPAVVRAAAQRVLGREADDERVALQGLEPCRRRAASAGRVSLREMAVGWSERAPAAESRSSACVAVAAAAARCLLPPPSLLSTLPRRLPWS